MENIPYFIIGIEAMIGLAILIIIAVLAVRRYEEKQGEDFSHDN